MHYWGNGDWSWWNWAAMTVGMAAFWGLVLWAIISLVRSSSNPRGPTMGPDPE